MKQITQEQLLKLAENGGNDASLLLLEKITEVENDTEEKISDFTTKIDQKLSSIDTQLRGLSEVKPLDEQLEKVAMKVAVKLVDIEKGDKGDDYILTNDDKKEIAGMIAVPVVEKVIEKIEVIKEQPIVTNEIKEVAISDTPQQIADKLNIEKEIIEQETIIGLTKKLESLDKKISDKSKTSIIGGAVVGGDVIQAGTNIDVSSSNGVKIITLNIPVQTTAPSNPVLNQLWIDNS